MRACIVRRQVMKCFCSSRGKWLHERPRQMQGPNHGWKVEGDQGLGPNTNSAPRARPKAALGFGCGRGSPPPAVRVRGYDPPGKFVKTQMLNPAFWWLLAVKFLAFWKLRPRSWWTNTLLVPNLKVGGPVSPGPYGCCAYGQICHH